jgi:hypothetical protein
MNDPFEWDDGENSEAALEIDNELLMQQLGLSEGSIFKSEDASPYIQNQFLRHIQAFQEMEGGPQRVLSTIFPDGFEFPPVESLDRAQLKEKLRAIEEVLGEHRIFLDLAPSLPDKMVYEYIIKEVIHQPISLEFPKGFALHFDGCDGYCPGCFQRDFCEHRIDDWSEDPYPKEKSDEGSSSEEVK